MKKIILKILNNLETVGSFAVFSTNAVRYMFMPPFRTKLAIHQLYIIGVESIMIISLSNMAMGMIFSLQMVIELSRLNAQDFVPNVLAQALTRELSPIIATLMLIAKNGSAITAEIGSMNTNEQLYALKTMSVNPIQYIVSPRLFACAIMFPVLTGLGNIMGMIGGGIIAFGLMHLQFAFPMNYMFNRLEPADIIVGLVKACIMGIAVCLICSFYGFRAEKGSTGVGKATTHAVVVASVTILIIDLLISQILILFGLQ